MDLNPCADGVYCREHQPGSKSITLTRPSPRRNSKRRGKSTISKRTQFYYSVIQVTLSPRSRTFSERIETAIQRYKAKRNFDSEKKDVFDKYMSFGGIDTGPKMFTGGLDANMLDEHDAKEIRDITATNFVGSDKANIGKDSSIWTVDFEGVVKGFL